MNIHCSTEASPNPIQSFPFSSLFELNFLPHKIDFTHWNGNKPPQSRYISHTERFQHYQGTQECCFSQSSTHFNSWCYLFSFVTKGYFQLAKRHFFVQNTYQLTANSRILEVKHVGRLQVEYKSVHQSIAKQFPCFSIFSSSSLVKLVIMWVWKMF